MSWGLLILLIVIFVCFTLLLFIQIPDFGFFIETYFIIILIVLFLILIFTIDFDNPITTTVYINKTAESAKNTLIYDVPYNADDGYSNLMEASFSGLWSGPDDSVNGTPAFDKVIFNYDTFTTTGILGGKITFTKLPNYQLQVDIDPAVGDAHFINGYLTMFLLCTGSQSINNKFELVSS